jgi:hypothetical protein
MGNLFQSGESWSGLEIKACDKKNAGIFKSLMKDKKIKFNRPGQPPKPGSNFKIMVIP